MATSDYKMFPHKLALLKFFGDYLPKLNVNASARMAPFMYVYDGKLHVARTFHAYLRELEEYADLGIDLKHSVQRGPFFIIFFEKPLREPALIKADPASEVKVEDLIGGITIESPVKEDTEVHVTVQPIAQENPLVVEARSLYNESDKRGSKLALEAFGVKHGITLNKGKTFEGMLADFELAVKA